MKCPTCDGTGHARSSRSKCPYHVKSKAEANQEFTETSLSNTCKNTNMILEVQKLAFLITQAIYTGSMFANYYYHDRVKNRQVSAAITHNLVY